MKSYFVFKLRGATRVSVIKIDEIHKNIHNILTHNTQICSLNLFAVTVFASLTGGGTVGQIVIKCAIVLKPPQMVSKF
jgi:hypothetical protein